MQNKYYDELIELIKNHSDDEIKEALDNYHASDIADVLEDLSKEERIRIYNILGLEKTAEIVPFYDDVEDFIEELTPEYTADILEEMDSDDAIDVLNELDDEDKEEIIDLMEKDSKETLRALDLYDEETIGSYMSDNFITIKKSDSITKAMSQMVKQAGEHDNIFTLYVLDENNKFYGAVDLRDLIVARKTDELESVIKTSYPYLYDDQETSEVIGKIKEYGEASLPILNHNDEIVGVITSEQILEAAEDELTEDYAKLGGLTSEEDIDESVFVSIKKRIPWLIILLFLGLIVATVIGQFEPVIAAIPVIVFFQSMILDMAGNVGTQSLAVTIRNITDESFKDDKKKQRKSIFKELRVGFFNGLIMGTIALTFVLLYLFITKQNVLGDTSYVFVDSLKVAGIIGFSMCVSILLSSLIGTVFPIMLNKLKIDPAVASGPFITTINDIIAVVVYYGLAYIFFLAI